MKGLLSENWSIKDEDVEGEQGEDNEQEKGVRSVL
jgi:hypothetical protein